MSGLLLNKMAKIFQAIDVDGNGVVSLEELKAALTKAGMPEEAVQGIFDAADMVRCGADIFVQLSMTCNRAGALRALRTPHSARSASSL